MTNYGFYFSGLKPTAKNMQASYRIYPVVPSGYRTAQYRLCRNSTDSSCLTGGPFTEMPNDGSFVTVSVGSGEYVDLYFAFVPN